MAPRRPLCAAGATGLPAAHAEGLPLASNWGAFVRCGRRAHHETTPLGFGEPQLQKLHGVVCARCAREHVDPHPGRLLAAPPREEPRPDHALDELLELALLRLVEVPHVTPAARGALSAPAAAIGPANVSRVAPAGAPSNAARSAGLGIRPIRRTCRASSPFSRLRSFEATGSRSSASVTLPGLALKAVVRHIRRPLGRKCRWPCVWRVPSAGRLLRPRLSTVWYRLAGLRPT